jgi:hypothetical protein
MRRRNTVIGVMAIVALSLAGCGDKFQEQFKDAPLGAVRNDTAMDLVNGADGFSNLGTKCDHGNRLYVAYHGDGQYAAVAVVPQDPTCAEG